MNKKKNVKHQTGKLSIVIPAYNEDKTIVSILAKVVNVKLPGCIDKEILVIDDCSVDTTTQKVKEFIRLHPQANIKYNKHTKNKGKGAAVQTGIHLSTGDFIIIQDADLEYDPNDYPALLQPILAGKYKVVYGSRLLNKNNTYSYRTFYWGGRVVSFITSMLYCQKITDEPTCYKMFDASLLKSVSLTSNGFGFCPEVTAKVLRMGYKIKEVPITYHPRSIDEGKKIKWYDGIDAIRILLRYRFYSSPKYRHSYKTNMLKKVRWNIASVLIASLFLWVCSKAFPSYDWLHTMLRTNFKTASVNKHLTNNQRREAKLGFNFSYLMLLKEHTPEDAVIWMPQREAYFPEGTESLFTHEIVTKTYRLRVLYPRKIVDAEEEPGNKYIREVTHVAIVNGRGAERLNLAFEEIPDYAIYPVHKLNNKVK